MKFLKNVLVVGQETSSMTALIRRSLWETSTATSIITCKSYKEAEEVLKKASDAFSLICIEDFVTGFFNEESAHVLLRSIRESSSHEALFILFGDPLYEGECNSIFHACGFSTEKVVYLPVEEIAKPTKLNKELKLVPMG